MEFSVRDDLSNPLLLNHTYVSSYFTTSEATAVSSPRNLEPPEAKSTAISALTCLRPRGLMWFRAWFGGLCEPRPHDESLQPCIKSDVQLWLCRQLWKLILEVYCFTLSPQASLVSAVGWDNSPECFRDLLFRGLLETWEQLKAKTLERLGRMHWPPKVSNFPRSQTELLNKRASWSCRWGGNFSDDTVIFMASFTEEPPQQ